MNYVTFSNSLEQTHEASSKSSFERLTGKGHRKCLPRRLFELKVERSCDKYRLYYEVQVSLRFTHRRPKAQGCVNREKTKPSDITDLYHGLRDPDNASTA